MAVQNGHHAEISAETGQGFSEQSQPSARLFEDSYSDIVSGCDKFKQAVGAKLDENHITGTDIGLLLVCPPLFCGKKAVEGAINEFNRENPDFQERLGKELDSGRELRAMQNSPFNYAIARAADLISNLFPIDYE